MEILNSKIRIPAQLSAKVIEAGGRSKNLGVISSDVVAFRDSAIWRKLKKLFGPATAVAIILAAEKLGRNPLELVPLFGLVTNAGANYMAADFVSDTAPLINFKYHASGTGAVAAAVTDTALGTEVTDNARPAGTPSNPSGNVFQSLATISYTIAHTITEWGLLSALTTGTLWDRRVFAGIAVSSTISIQFTYQLTVSSGGS